MGKKSTKTTNQTIYGDTTTTNPYVTSHTTNKGTASVLNPNTAFDSINDFVNENMDSLLNQYLNPSLNSVTNQSKLKSYADSLNTETAKNLENNIINPLSKRNMLRSSQANDMYNSLALNNANQLGSYAKELLNNSQSDMAQTLSNLMLLYMNGYNAVANNQQQSLTTSQGNATKTQTAVESSNLVSQMMQMAMQVAMTAMATMK